jgi:hypothetical protein
MRAGASGLLDESYLVHRSSLMHRAASQALYLKTHESVALPLYAALPDDGQKIETSVAAAAK